MLILAGNWHIFRIITALVKAQLSAIENHLNFLLGLILVVSREIDCDEKVVCGYY